MLGLPETLLIISFGGAILLGGAPPQAALGPTGWPGEFSGRPLYFHLGGLRHRSGRGEHRQRLHPVRANRHHAADPDRGVGDHDLCGPHVSVPGAAHVPEVPGAAPRVVLPAGHRHQLPGHVQAHPLAHGSYRTCWARRSCFWPSGCPGPPVSAKPSCRRVFHAVSAFCNAGFSLYDDNLLGLRHNYLFTTTIMVLIVIGGLGHTVVHEVWRRLEYRFSLLAGRAAGPPAAFPCIPGWCCGSPAS